jgi:hypothetical protein|tara:strand:+ start:25698 stop:25937 length:240 start_codon:yes stop_codon:yes gene_type:complete
MDLVELEDRLDFLITEMYNSNISVDDVRDEIEDELKEFMPEDIYKSYFKKLEYFEEQAFQSDWNILDGDSYGSYNETDW